ncbi:hypothetical protein Tco_0174465 [Tanacetum coccineum]
MAQRSFDAALRSALERIITASGHGFGDWQWRLDTLPFAFGGLGIYCAHDVLNYTFLASKLKSAILQTKLLQHSCIIDYAPAFNDALCVFNTKMETGLLSNTSEITSPKLMKKLADIYFTRVTQTAESTFSLSSRQMALCPPIFCFSACSKVFTGDIYEDHVVSCAGIIGFKHQDNVVRNTLVDICFRSGILAGIEVDIGLGGGCLALTQTGMVDFMSVRVAIDVAHRKQVKYKAKCADIRYGFLPLLFSLLGELEKDVATLLKRIRKFFVTQDIGERAAIQIFNRIGFAIAKGVGPQLVYRLPTNFMLATLPFTFRGLGVYSAVDVLNYAFLTSILHSASLQIKLLRHSDSLVKYQMKDRTSDWLRAVPISSLE